MLITSKSFLDFIKQCDNVIAKALWVMTEDTDVMDLYSSVNEYLDAKALYNQYITTKAVNYLNINQFDQLTFLPSNKEHIVNSIRSWSPKNRQQTTPQRLIRKLLTPEGLAFFKEKEIDDFGKCFEVYKNEDKFVFEVLEGSQISTVYSYDVSDMETGSLCESCMRDVDSEFFDIYVAANAKIITMYEKGDFVARALLWNVYVEEFDKEILFMDRIYSFRDIHQKAMQLFAKRQGFYQKCYQSSDSKHLVVDPEGKVQILTMSVKVPNLGDFTYYPYVDTFSIGDTKSNTIHNILILDKESYKQDDYYYVDHDIYVFNETDGDYNSNLSSDFFYNDDSYKKKPFYSTKTRKLYTKEDYNNLNYDFFTGI